MTCGVLAALTSGAAGWADIAVSVAGGGVLVPVRDGDGSARRVDR